MKVLVLGDGNDFEVKMTLRALEEAAPGWQIVTALTLEEVDRITEGGQVQVILLWTCPMNILDRAVTRSPALRWIHTKNAGLNTVLSPAVLASPVPLTHGKGTYSSSLAEWTLMAILVFAKDLARLQRQKEEKQWTPFHCVEISTQTVGIIGFGDIGRTVARKCRSLGMRIVAYSRSVPAGQRVAGTDPDADELIGDVALVASSCDYLVAALPLTAETSKPPLLNAAVFQAMRQGSVFINVGRGPTVDEPALLSCLSPGGNLRGAALDVLAVEPLPKDSPFWTLPNVIVSPHSADWTTTAGRDMAALAAGNMRALLEGKTLQNIVADKTKGY